MEPTPNPATPPAVGSPLIEYVRTQRQNAGSILAILSVVFLGLTIFLALRAVQTPSTPEKENEKSTIDKSLDSEKPDTAKSEKMTSKQVDSVIGAIGTMIAFLGVGLIAAWMIVGIPDPSEEKQRTEARIQLLALGGGLGLLLIAFGGIYFYQWSDSLVNWLDKGQRKEQIWAIVPLLLVVVGAGLVLAAVQPARAEERHNTLVRRLIYGSNLGLTAMLLLVAVVVANVIFAYKVTNKFDVTESNFYTMSPQTEEFLGRMDATIQAYAILPNSSRREVSDLRDVLQRFQEESKNKFQVTFINPMTNSIELETLKTEYPTIQDERGVLLVFASDKKRFSFIPIDDFFSREGGGMPGQSEAPRMVFVGEGRLVKELLFLADNKQRPKVYFTQASEEMQVTGQDPRSVSSLKDFLEKNYLEVLQLSLTKENAKVPDDCAVLVVADPQKPLPPYAVDAIRKYMTEPLTAGRKGKLVVLSGATLPTDRNRKVTPTGLENVLRDFNVELGQKYVFVNDSDRNVSPVQAPVGFITEAIRSQNPIARLFRKISIDMPFPREVEHLKTSPTFTATPLLGTGSNDGAWTEEEFPTDFRKSLLSADKERRLRSTIPVGVLVSEGPTARVAVYGNGLMVSNALASRYAPDSPPAFDLVGATIDWLRDRPPVPSSVIGKPYKQYVLPNPKSLDSSRLRYLPIWLSLLAVGGLGLGVWVTRRQQS